MCNMVYMQPREKVETEQKCTNMCNMDIVRTLMSKMSGNLQKRANKKQLLKQSAMTYIEEMAFHTCLHKSSPKEQL